MKARFVLVATVAAALVALPAGALGSSSHITTNAQSFADSVGEDADAPDITSVDVSNTDAGLITFQIAISNRPAFTPDMAVLVCLDTDANPATGDPQSLGADYVIELDPGSVGLFKWNGTTFDNAPSATTVTYGYDATGATIRVGIQDLGGTKAINFGADAISGITIDASGNADFTNAHDDLAPDPGHGFFNYSVITKLTLKQTRVLLHAEAGEVRCTTDRDAGGDRERYRRAGRKGDDHLRRHDQGRASPCDSFAGERRRELLLAGAEDSEGQDAARQDHDHLAGHDARAQLHNEDPLTETARARCTRCGAPRSLLD